jgi:hypothetical protein
MSILQDMMQGYVEKTFGRQSGATKAGEAQNTATAYQQLQDAIAQDYRQQKEQFESNPANKGQSWSTPSTEERFNDQVQAMIMSGDPNLQARGLQLMTPDAQTKPTEFQRNFEFMKQAQPGLTEMEYFKMLHPGPASTNVNIKMDQPMSVDDMQKLMLPNGQPPIPGMTMRQAGEMGARIAQTKEQGAQGVSTDVMGNAFDSLHDNIDPSNNPKQAALDVVRTNPGMVGQAANFIAGVAGIPSNPKADKFQQSTSQLSAQMLKLMSGASATDQEYERIRNLYPQQTDSPETRRIKYNAMLAEAEAMSKRAKAQGVTNVPDFSRIPRFNVNKAPASSQQTQQPQQQQVIPQKKGPIQRTTKSGVTYTVEE